MPLLPLAVLVRQQLSTLEQLMEEPVMDRSLVASLWQQPHHHQQQQLVDHCLPAAGTIR